MSRSFKLTAFVLLLLAAITAGLGVWQLGRAAKKKQLQQQWQAVQRRSPIDLNVLSTDFTQHAQDIEQGQQASAAGDLLLQDALLLAPRTLENGQGGKLGAWWLAPLLLHSDENGSMSSSAVLVLVGWVANENISQLPKTIQTHVSLQGHVVRDISAYTRLAAEHYADFSKPWLNFDWQNYKIVWQNKHADLTLLPLILQLDTATGSKVEPVPSLLKVYMTVERHYGYAITWFSFSAVAFGVLMVMLWRQMRAPSKWTNRGRRRIRITKYVKE